MHNEETEEIFQEITPPLKPERIPFDIVVTLPKEKTSYSIT